MAKKGIKIKDLARELGVTSREVITKCRVEGIPAQNSITRLRLESERAVRAFFSETNPQHNAESTNGKPAREGDATLRVRLDRFRS